MPERTSKSAEAKRVGKILAAAKALAADYYQLTGKPLGVTGEVAEYVAARTPFTSNSRRHARPGTTLHASKREGSNASRLRAVPFSLESTTIERNIIAAPSGRARSVPGGNNNRLACPRH